MVVDDHCISGEIFDLVACTDHGIAIGDIDA